MLLMPSIIINAGIGSSSGDERIPLKSRQPRRHALVISDPAKLAAYRAWDDVLMLTAAQTLVLVDLEERKAVPIPSAYREPIRAFEGGDLDN
jgi:hypothetical protein